MTVSPLMERVMNKIITDFVKRVYVGSLKMKLTWAPGKGEKMQQEKYSDFEFFRVRWLT